MPLNENTATNPDVTTDAGFRAWGSAISACLLAAGLTKTSDTGQINWATVTAPALNTVAGYEIWRFNDAEQATTPVFIKLEYAKGGATTRFSIRVGVGSGTDGAGTLSGASNTVTMTHSGTLSANGLISACYDGAGMAVNISQLNTTSANSRQLIVIERLRSADDGSYTSDLVLITNLTNNSPLIQSRISGTWDTSGGLVSVPGTVSVGGKVLFGTYRCIDGPYMPLRTVIAGPSGSHNAGDMGNVEVAGDVKGYKAIAFVGNQEVHGTGQAAQLALMTTD